MSLSGTGKRYTATEGRNRRKRKKTIQKLISVANEEKKKTVKHEQNSNQKNNNRQNKTQEIEKNKWERRTLSFSLISLFLPFPNVNHI